MCKVFDRESSRKLCKFSTLSSRASDGDVTLLRALDELWESQSLKRYFRAQVYPEHRNGLRLEWIFCCAAVLLSIFSCPISQQRL